MSIIYKDGKAYDTIYDMYVDEFEDATDEEIEIWLKNNNFWNIDVSKITKEDLEILKNNWRLDLDKVEIDDDKYIIKRETEYYYHQCQSTEYHYLSYDENGNIIWVEDENMAFVFKSSYKTLEELISKLPTEKDNSNDTYTYAIIEIDDDEKEKSQMDINERIKELEKENENFIQIPFNNLIHQLQYKSEEEGINVIITEESYTSKASFLNLDEMPVYGKEKEEPVFSGYRKHRGLYKIKGCKTTINADVNGAYNIIRKVFPNVFELSHGNIQLTNGIAGVVVHPVKFNMN